MSYEKVEISVEMMVRSALTIRCLITLRWLYRNKRNHNVATNAKFNGNPYSHADTQFKNVPSAFQVGYSMILVD